MEKSKLKNIDNFGCIGEIELLIGEKNETFANDLASEVITAQSLNKRVEYLSERIIIYSSKYTLDENQDLLIFELVNRKSKNEEREYYYIANKNLHASYLLNLISKGEMK
ncbi:MAG: hypothetical protein KGD73_01900 [Candidatus Lokiarchaeota archaeon]|nr:hypothetical protein [Candidatus Lokiarchaeota archaeon]